MGLARTLCSRGLFIGISLPIIGRKSAVPPPLRTSSMMFYGKNFRYGIKNCLKRLRSRLNGQPTGTGSRKPPKNGGGEQGVQGEETPKRLPGLPGKMSV